MKKKILMPMLLCVLMLTLFIGCGHEHVWEEADCTHPKTCLECGATEGEPLGHTWEDATCIKPKTCSVCGVTEGEPLGHDVNFGKCSRCNTFVNFDIVEKIMSAVKETSETIHNASEEVVEAAYDIENASYYMNKSLDYLDSVEESYREICNLCGDYEDLADIKEAFDTAIDNIPSKIYSNDVSSISEWVSDYQDFLDVSVDANKKALIFIKSLKY